MLFRSFLILRDLLDGALPKWKEASSPEPVKLADAKNLLMRALKRASDAFGAQVWQNTNFQPTMFRLAEIAGYIKVLESTAWRTEWLKSVTPAGSVHRQIAEEACAGYADHAAAEIDRLHGEFERDFALLKQGLYPPEIRVAQLSMWESPAERADCSRACQARPQRTIEVMNVTPVLSPHPRVMEGERSEEHTSELPVTQ